MIHDTRTKTDDHREDADPILISGFLSAIQEFLRSLTNADLKVIDTGREKIIIHRTDNISIAAISNVDLVNDIYNMLIGIASSFENMFEIELTNTSSTTDMSTFYKFNGILDEELQLDQLISINPNDIFRRVPTALIKTKTDELIEEFGSDFISIIDKLDGKKTLYQIMEAESLLAGIPNFEMKLKTFYKLGYTKKVSEGHRQIQIMTMMFGALTYQFRRILGNDKVVEILKESIDHTNNPFAQFLTIQSDPKVFVDFHELEMGLYDDPTMALLSEFQDLINILVDFIAKIQINGMASIVEINSSLEVIIQSFNHMFPSDKFVSRFGDILSFMIIN